MRTRRSPRNQQALWKALTPPVDKPTQDPTPPPVNRCWDCVSYPKGGRSRGDCTLLGVMVCGQTANRPCFRHRDANPSGLVMRIVDGEYVFVKEAEGRE